MWLLSGKVSEDIFRKQLERTVGAVATHLQQQQQGGYNIPGWLGQSVPVCSAQSLLKAVGLPLHQRFIGYPAVRVEF